MIEFLRQLAQLAGSMAYADQLWLENVKIHFKGNIRDLVTDTDRKVEEFIITGLQNTFRFTVFAEKNQEKIIRITNIVSLLTPLMEQPRLFMVSQPGVSRLASPGTANPSPG